MPLHSSSVLPVAACLFLCACCQHVIWVKSYENRASGTALHCSVTFENDHSNSFYLLCGAIYNSMQLYFYALERMSLPLDRFMDSVNCYLFHTGLDNSKLIAVPDGEYVLPTRDIQSMSWISFEAKNLSSDFLCPLTHLQSFHIKGEDHRSMPLWDFRIFSQLHDPDGSRNCCICSIRKVTVELVRISAILNDTFRGVPSMEILVFEGTLIRYIEENAFAPVQKLRELQIVDADLVTFAANSFAPLVHLQRLRLLGNGINETVFHDLRGFTDLMTLNLRDNSISNIDDTETFLSFRNLRTLDLSRNKIRHIEKGIFEKMEQILNITLECNELEFLPDDLIESNAHLAFLDLTGNALTSIPKLNSSTLKHLKMNRNRISDFSMSDTGKLCECPNLKILELDNNKIISIHLGAFKCSAKLTRIDLSANRIERIDSVFHESKVEYLNLELNRITRFSFKDFSVHLLELNLRRNKIEEFPKLENVLHYPMELRKLNLNSNFLKNLTGVLLPSKLEELDLSRNNITSFSFAKINTSHEFIVPENLKSIDLRFNYLYTLCPLLRILLIKKYEFHFYLNYNPVMCPCEVMMFQELRKNGSRMILGERRHRPTCDAVFGKLVAEASLTMAHRRGSKLSFQCDDPSNSNCQCNRHGSYVSMCKFECPEICTCFIDRDFGSYWMDCSDRSLLRIPYLPFPPKLNVILDFSKNLLRRLDGNSFPEILLASELYLQNNRLTKIAADAFDGVPDLQILNLQFNSLEDLPSSVFASLRKLTELNLADNRLIHFHAVIPASWTVGHWTFPAILMLSNNSWSCECDNVKTFRNWLQRFVQRVTDANELTCVSTDDSSKAFKILSHPFLHCYTKVMDRVIPILSSVISVMGFLAVLLLLIYVYRRELEVILYSRTGLRFSKEKEAKGVDRVYDAFVAYSGEDVEFVALELVPGLENIQNPYKLCVHERNFLPGIPILENIQAAIDYSQRTLVVLSSNFVESRWCHFEFKTAHHRMISDPSHRLIVILLEEVPSGIDYEMKVYLRTNTYLKWGDRLFWEKLYHAMPDRRRVDNADVQLTTLCS